MKESQLASLKRVLEDHFNIEVVLLDNNELICHCDDLIITVEELQDLFITASFKNTVKQLEIVPSVFHMKDIDRSEVLKYVITNLIREVACAFYTLKREKVS